MSDSARDSARDSDEIAAFYARGLERDRLAAGQGALELARTRLVLERCLPAPPAVIADVGGGPGRYAIWLADRGYDVHLVDPIPLHIEQARTDAERAGVVLAIVSASGTPSTPRVVNRRTISSWDDADPASRGFSPGVRGG